MRAALAYAYGKSHKRGTEAWKKIPNSEKYEAGKKVPNTERYEGNPTTSTVLRHYMKSLRKRKVRGAYYLNNLYSMLNFIPV